MGQQQRETCKGGVVRRGEREGLEEGRGTWVEMGWEGEVGRGGM